jgi:hypothetical protein
VPAHTMGGTLKQLAGCLMVSAAIACCAATLGHAQNSAVSRAALFAPLVGYTANESGGRISMADPRGDSVAVETIRLHLLENAAAIRRGDFRSVRIIRTDLPAIQVLVDHRGSVRCLFRPSPRGGELVLLSDDDFVVTAIHQVLAAPPKTRVRL